MTELNIEYCVPCGFQESAIETQEALLEAFGEDIDGIRLETGHGGVFKVTADEELIWDKDEDGGIDTDGITDRVGERIDA